MDPDLLGRKDKRILDDQYLYLKYFIDLNGRKIYSKKQIEIIEVKKPYDAYQSHLQLAETIVNEDSELNSIFEKLSEEFPILIGDSQSNFLVFWGYVLVDLCSLTTENYLYWDTRTISEEVKKEILKEDPLPMFVARCDFAYGSYGEDNKQQLHERILKEKKCLKRIGVKKKM